MGSFAQSLGIGPDTLASWLLALVLVQAVTLVFLAVLWRRVVGSAKRWDDLLRDSEGLGAMDLLRQHLGRLHDHEERLSQADARVSALDSRLSRSVRRFGLVKYDAFEDVGGKQSFALALTDDGGNGVVLTSLVGRTECRVFAKTLVGGRAEVSMTADEEAAVQAAGRWD